MNKEQICAAFCDEVAVRKVPAGFAVKTGFQSADGDPIGFYVVNRPDDPNEWRLEDSGIMVPMLQASGITLRSGTRAEAFEQLLTEYRAQFDEDSQEIISAWMPEQEIAAASLNFVALLLRLQDLELLSPDTVENTFRQDAQKAIAARFGSQVAVKIDSPISEQLSHYVVDALLGNEDDNPVAVYFATSEPRVDEAVILAMESRMKGLSVKVILLMEYIKPKHVTDRALARAHNLLDGLPVFRGFESNAMDKIASYVQGTPTRQ